jgi:hypothetical protein
MIYKHNDGVSSNEVMADVIDWRIWNIIYVEPELLLSSKGYFRWCQWAMRNNESTVLLEVARRSSVPSIGSWKRLEV